MKTKLTILFLIVAVIALGQSTTSSTSSSAQLSGWVATTDDGNSYSPDGNAYGHIPKCPVCGKKHRPPCYTPVPEPSTYGAIFVGTTLLGVMAYRKFGKKKS